jgi:transcription initiation factor TFIIH subunit 2
MGSLTTCDPTDIDTTIQTCKSSNVRCSVICLAAEVRIFKHLANVTGGEFGVILDDSHFRDLLHAQLEPPPSSAAAEASLIKMGFPCHSGHQSEAAPESHSGLGLCMCHLDASGAGSKLSVSGFLCPQVE